jgi:hypothetical protein
VNFFFAMKRFLHFSLAGSLSLTTASQAEDWPRHLGAGNDANWNESDVIESIPGEAGKRPEVLWRVPVGLGLQRAGGGEWQGVRPGLPQDGG